MGDADADSAGAAASGACAKGGAPAKAERDAPGELSEDEVTAALEDAVSQRSGTLTRKIAALKEARQRAARERRDVAKELRNAERRRRRLKKKAKELHPDDLVELLAMRQEAKKLRKSTEEQHLDESREEKAGSGDGFAIALWGWWLSGCLKYFVFLLSGA